MLGFKLPFLVTINLAHVWNNLGLSLAEGVIS